MQTRIYPNDPKRKKTTTRGQFPSRKEETTGSLKRRRWLCRPQGEHRREREEKKKNTLNFLASSFLDPNRNSHASLSLSLSTKRNPSEDPSPSLPTYQSHFLILAPLPRSNYTGQFLFFSFLFYFSFCNFLVLIFFFLC